MVIDNAMTRESRPTPPTPVPTPIPTFAFFESPELWLLGTGVVNAGTFVVDALIEGVVFGVGVMLSETKMVEVTTEGVIGEVMLSVSVVDRDVCCEDRDEDSGLVEGIEDCDVGEERLTADDSVSVTVDVEVQFEIEGQREVTKFSLKFAVSVRS
ncbi:hypothetical protein LTR10_017190 [Elasticomyces elasticus]|uniref:Uncharacterized protein n=1 Tax=Exophiala sideris TaxID=1016849 RepID=A0ABR0J5Y1_9EURO|nr:hypothetical protein LTR10_017190 [Elasticomyces elasticus]KAK5028454.1 hypothetical protein LTS07_006545 [Exophiala sideris]KAK5035904.1 hypothetical protein LTR13_005474 [Exophiala sideris]KAK5056940.1 hypothetical protein LTR69_007578 [Exophiala sideris]KAK5181347.1 hypothetical protein LTR44_006142 [Eurotiomycetes sp. CCFEE 6388]